MRVAGGRVAVTRHVSARVALVSSSVFLAAILGHAQAPQAPAAGGGGGRGGNDALVGALWTAFDADKDSAITRAELKSAFAKWYDAADTAKGGTGDDQSARPGAEHQPGTTGSRAGAGRWRPRGQCATAVDGSGVRRARQSADRRTNALP